MKNLKIKIPKLNSNTRATGVVSWGNGAPFSMAVTWETTPNVAGGYTTVTVTMRVANASVQGNCLAGSHITINGNRKDFAGHYINNPQVGNVTINSHSVNVYHTGAFNCAISGHWQWNGYIYINGGYTGTFNSVSGSSTITLDAIQQAPAAPANCTATGRYERGENINVTWPAVAGATGYDAQYSQWDSNGTWSAWHNVPDAINGTTVNHSINIIDDNKYRLKYRVRAKNSAGTSNWSPESGEVYHFGVKSNQNGFIWTTVRVWNGSAWVNAMPRVWNGNAWTNTR